MAFKLKNKFTSSGLMNHMPGKAKLINNSKAAFYQQLPENFVTTQSATMLDGTIVPVEGTVTTKKQYEGSRPYEVVYDEFEVDPVTGGKINSKTGKVYSNIDEFKADAIKDSEVTTVYKGDYDRTDGKPSYNTRMSTNVLNLIPVFKGMELDGELPYGKQKEILVSYLRKNKDMDSARKKEIMKGFKAKWEEVNERTLTSKKRKGTSESETYVAPTPQN